MDWNGSGGGGAGYKYISKSQVAKEGGGYKKMDTRATCISVASSVLEA